jgi:alkylated DNA repair dioxygenase AlkB
VEIGKTPFAPAQSGKTKQHFGANFNFNKRKLNVSRFHGLPEYGLVLEARLVDAFRHTLDPSSADGKAMRCALANFDTTDLFVLRYQEREASNLDLHIDDTFAYGEAIFDVSLETDSVMTFVRAESPRHATHSIDPGASIECIRVTLQAGSAALLYGPARYEWEHGILHYDVRGQRTSITLRTLSDPLRNTEDGKRVLEVARSALPRGTEGAAPTAARPCSGGTEA